MEAKNERGQTEAEFLAAYDRTRYERPSVTVDICVFSGDEVLLIRRKEHPNIGKWALPGGFIEMWETLHQSAVRELEEETGIAGVVLTPFGMFGEPLRDPRMRILTAAFYVEVDKAAVRVAAGDDAADAAWFKVSIKSLGITEIPHGKCGAFPLTACGEAYGSTGIGTRLTLTREDEILCAILAHSQGTDVLLGAEIAGDHALIIYKALKAAGKL